MSKARLAITAVIEEGRPVAEVARAYGMHRAGCTGWSPDTGPRARPGLSSAPEGRTPIRPPYWPRWSSLKRAIERLLGPRRNHVMSADPIQSQGDS